MAICFVCMEEEPCPCDEFDEFFYNTTMRPGPCGCVTCACSHETLDGEACNDCLIGIHQQEVVAYARTEDSTPDTTI